MNQLLGKDRKKKKIRGTPAEKKKNHQSSPERKVAPDAVPSIFDRKPLPGIGRQAVHGDGDLSSLASSPTHLKTVTARDSPTSRFHAHSLVGHRLSQHLSVSAESEEGAPESGDRPNAKGNKGTKRLWTTVDDQRREESAGFFKENSEHSAALQVRLQRVLDCRHTKCHEEPSPALNLTMKNTIPAYTERTYSRCVW